MHADLVVYVNFSWPAIAHTIRPMWRFRAASVLASLDPDITGHIRLTPPASPQPFQQRAQQIDRQRKHDRRVLVGRDRRQRLQVAQLHRLRLQREPLRGLQQLLRRLQFAFRVNHLRAPLAFGLGLPRDRADHRLVKVDVLVLDRRHLDPPRIGLRVERLLDVGVQLLALGEQRVEFMLAEHGAQRRLRELARRLEKARHLDHGLLRIDHAEIHDRIDLHRYVVTCDHVLRGHVEHDGAQVDPHDLLDDRDDQHEPRPLHLPEAAEHEHHAALVLAEDADRRRDEYHDENDQDAAEAERVTDHEGSPWCCSRCRSCAGTS
jgi:hypothetical protein